MPPYLVERTFPDGRSSPRLLPTMEDCPVLDAPDAEAAWREKAANFTSTWAAGRLKAGPAHWEERQPAQVYGRSEVSPQ
jgi:hypothetical protein